MADPLNQFSRLTKLTPLIDTLLINRLERLDAFGPDNTLECPSGLGWFFFPEFRTALSSFRHVDVDFPACWSILGASRKVAVL
ncbi:uncharacterized protein PG986_002262 [Apiospora aurea]|uniref:Uncharacterized protein n=1 Tax=Apiospora aurea TaxID=335848 RepID=A0ABR1QZ72_9PEZI